MITLGEALADADSKNYTAEQKVGTIQRYREYAATQVSKDADPEKAFRFLSDIDDKASIALDRLRQEAAVTEFNKQFPDPVARMEYATRSAHGQMEQGAGYTPSGFEPQTDAIREATKKFSLPRKVQDIVEFDGNVVGRTIARPIGENNYQVMVKGVKPGTTDYAGPASIHTVNTDREAIAAREQERVDTLTKELDSLESSFKTDQYSFGGGRAEGDPATSYAAARDYVAAERDKHAAKLNIAKNGSIGQVVQMELFPKLQEDENFKASIPNNWLSQFIARPVVGAMKGFAQTGAAIIGDKQFLSDSEGAFNTVVPGAMRNRFEAKSTPVADLGAQGLESLVTFAGPGIAIKAGEKALAAVSLFGKSAAAAGALSKAIGEVPAIDGLISKVGFSGFGITAFGNSYTGRMDLADAEKDPIKADEIRAWAPILALGDAIVEIVSEKILPADEKLILRGGKGTLLRRIGTAAAMPLNEGAEEVIGAIIKNTVLGAGTFAPGSRKEDYFDSFKGGLFGGVGFVPLAFHGNKVEKTPVAKSDGIETQWGFNGRYYPTQAAAKAEHDAANTTIESVIRPAGINTVQEAVRVLETLDAKDTLTDTEKALSEAIVNYGVLLPNEDGAPLAEGAPSNGTAAVLADGPGITDTNSISGKTVNQKDFTVAAPEAAPAPPAAPEAAPAPPAAPEAAPAPPAAPEAAPAPPAAPEAAPAPPAAPEIRAQNTPFQPPPDVVSALKDSFQGEVKFSRPENTSPQGKLIDLFSQAAKLKVVVFSGQLTAGGQTAVEGFIDVNNPDTIYVSDRTRQPLLHILGHEFWHSRQELPEYKKFSDELKRLEPEAWKRAQARGHIGDATNEFVADVVGSRFTQREFWNRLQRDMEPGVFRSFVEFVQKLWDKIKSAVGPRFVNVGDAARVDKMLSDLLRGKQIEEASRVFTEDARQEEISRFKANNPDTQARSIQASSVPTTPEPYNREDSLSVQVVGGYHLESGRVDYDSWKAAVIADLGPKAERYLRGAYEALRHSGVSTAGMTSAFDIDNPGPDSNPTGGPGVPDSQKNPDATLYRASTDGGAYAGAHFSESEEDAKAYQDNPGFGGPNLFSYRVNTENTADAKTLRDLARLLEPLLSEEQRQWAADNGGLVQAWNDAGFDHVFHALENEIGPRRDKINVGDLLKEAGNDWIRFIDDFPEGAVTYKFIGEGTLVPNENPPTPSSGASASLDTGNPGPAVREAPQLSPVGEQTLKEGGTGTKNAATEFLLKNKFGEDVVTEIIQETHDEVLDAAASQFSQDPNYGENLLVDLMNSKRAANQYEEAALMMMNLHYQNQSEAAAQAVEMAKTNGDIVAEGEQLNRLKAANDKLHALYEVERNSGTIWGRTGNFRRRLLARDYTLARMQSNYRVAANRGGQLSPSQDADVTAQNSKIKAADDAVKAAEEAAVDAKVEEYLNAFFAQWQAGAAAIKPDNLKAQADAAKARIKNRKPTIAASSVGRIQFSTIDPQLLNDLSIVGADLIANGATDLQSFMAAMQAEFGNQFDSDAQFIFDASKTRYSTIRAKGKKKANTAPATKQGATKALVDAAKLSGEEFPDRRIVKGLVRVEVESGVRGTKDVFDNVLASLTTDFPKLTLRKLKEIFVDYGNAVFPSTEEVKVQLRELHTLARLQVTLERIQNNMPALKSGPQRDKASLEVRTLEKQINDTKKKLGLDQKSDAQLAGAITAAKTRIRNQIEELNAMIAQGGRTADQRKPRPGITPDAELISLAKERDQLKESLDAIESKTPMTEAEKIDATIKALDRVEADLERRLASGEVRKPGAADTVTSDAIEEKRSYIATLRQALSELADPRTPAQRALDSANAALERMIALMEGRAAAPIPKDNKALSQAEEDIRLQIDAMRRVLAEERRLATAKPESERRVAAAQRLLAKAEQDLEDYNNGVEPSARAPKTPLTPEEKDLLDKAKGIRATLSIEKLVDRMQGELDSLLAGVEPAKPGKKISTPNPRIETLKQEIKRAKLALALKAEPARRVASLEKEKSRLERVMDGTEAPRETKGPKDPLTQREEDLRLEIAAMRKALAEEHRAATRTKKSDEQNQIEAAQKTLAKLEEILTTGVFPSAKVPTSPASDTVADLRSQILTAREAVAKLRSEDAALQLERQKAIVRTRMATLQAKLDHGDFSKKPEKTRAADAELRRLKADYRVIENEWARKLYLASLESRSLPKKVIGFFKDGIMASRLAELGFDLGVILRQGGRAIGHPIILAKGIATAFTSMTESRAAAAEADIVADPLFPIAKEAGLELTQFINPDKPSNQEELAASMWLQKPVHKPGDSKLKRNIRNVADLPIAPIRGLGQAQVAALNKIRLELFRSMCATMSRLGAPTMGDMKIFAQMVNVTTGRGTMATWEQAATGWLNAVFIAYRWAKSGLQYSVGYPLWAPWIAGTATARSTAVVAAEYARQLTGFALLYTTWAIANALNGGGGDDKWKIEFDPRSSRFGKIPIGDSLIDPTAGISQWVSLLTKLSNEAIYRVTGMDTGFRGKKTQGGKIVPLGDGGAERPTIGTGIGDEIGSFLRYKLSPIVGAFYSTVTGTDAIGQPATLRSEAQKLVWPLIFRDVQQAMEANGVGTGLALSVLAFFGVGVNTFQARTVENIPTEQRAWLYNNGITIPQLQDQTTMGQVLGMEKSFAEKQGLNVPLTDEKRTALLKASLADTKNAITIAKSSWESSGKTEKELKRIQSTLDAQVSRARTVAARNMQ